MQYFFGKKIIFEGKADSPLRVASIPRNLPHEWKKEIE